MGKILDAVVAALISAGSTVLVVGFAHRNKTSATEAPRHPVRRRLLDVIRRRPGAQSSVLARAVVANRGTANYHLLVLERIGAVRVVRHHHATRYFPADRDPRTLSLSAILLRGRILEVARAILSNPEISQHDLTQRLGISRKVFREYADLLGEAGLLAEERRAHRKCYVADPRLAGLIRELDGQADENDKTKDSADPPTGSSP